MSKGSEKSKKNNKRLLSLLIIAVFVAFGIYFSVTFVKQEFDISSLKAEAQNVQKETEEQKNYSKELIEDMKTENETKRVEETAREKLGYLKKNEILFVDSSAK